MSRFILFFLIALKSVSYTFSQKVQSSNYESYMQEVYGGTPYLEDSHKREYIEFMKKVEVKVWDGQDYPILETVYLKDKYNPNLKYDFGQKFDPLNFNPLKYQFDFYRESKSVYRVRDSKYMIVIYP